MTLFISYCSYKGLTLIKSSMVPVNTIPISYCSYKGLTHISNINGSNVFPFSLVIVLIKD